MPSAGKTETTGRKQTMQWTPTVTQPNTSLVMSEVDMSGDNITP